MKKYKYYLFDWDGCIAKTLDVWLFAYKTVFAQYGIFPKDKEISQKAFGAWNRIGKFGVVDVENYVKQLLNIVDQKIPNVKLYSHAKQMLATLKKQGNKLAIVTTSLREQLMPALRNNELDDFFDVIISGEDVVNHKPHPEIVEKAIAKLAATKKESIVIGDSSHDLGAAFNAGVDSILFYPKHHKKFYDRSTFETFPPTYEIASFREMITI